MKITIPLPGNWCLRNASGDILLLHAVGDIGIFFSYMLFAMALALFLWHKPHYRSPFIWQATAFVFLCGLTHLASTFTLYVAPAFLIEGLLKLATFAISLSAAISAPGALLKFSDLMHERNNRIQGLMLKEGELTTQISELNEAIARRDHHSQQRQESILKHQIESAKAMERLATTVDVLASEAKETFAIATEASKRVLARVSGEQSGQE